MAKKETPRAPAGKNAAGPVVAGGEATVGGKTYARKLVTLPHKKFADGVAMLVKPLAPMYKGQAQLDRKSGKPLLDEEGNPKQPVDMMKCEDLATGQPHTIIVGAVLKERLEEAYPGAAYVGKLFEFTQHKIEGKRWRDYAISELESA